MKGLACIFLTIFAAVVSMSAQTTEFTYQGSLKDNASLANANYDFEFALFDAASGGSQVGSTLSKNSVLVSSGAFAVKLDFGSVFPGANRYLEIRVKLTGQPTLTTLAPRQLVNSAPYSLKSLSSDAATNATNATNAVNATNFTGSLGGDVNGMQGGTVVNSVGGQSAANVGTAAQSVNAATSSNTANTLVKRDASGNFTAGTITASTFNANDYAIAGHGSVLSNANSGGNIFVGLLAGGGNTSLVGNNNTFVGYFSGHSNTTTPGFNTAIGSYSDGAPGIENSTALGGRASVTQSNSLVLGSINGVNGASADTNVGIGTTAPGSRLHVVGNGLFTGNLAANGTVSANSFSSINGYSLTGQGTVLSNANSGGNIFVGLGAGGNTSVVGNNNTFVGYLSGHSNTNPANNLAFNTAIGSYSDGAAGITNSTALGGRASVTQSNSLVLGSVNGVNDATADTNVGIGTTAPLSRLQVVTANDTNPSTITAWDARHFVVGGTASTGGIGASYDQTNNVGYFGTLHPGVAWGNLSLQSGGGNVGIGTTAPISRLHLNGNPVLTFTNNANTAGRRGYRLAFDNDRFSFQRADDAGNFAANQVSIDQVTGNVGIGTTNPTAKLHVTSGNVYIANPNSMIITSPNGACWFITVNNSGALSTIAVTCP